MRCGVTHLGMLSSVQLLLCFCLVTPSVALVNADGCWNGNQNCIIHATLHRPDELPSSAGLTVNIDCQLKPAESTIPVQNRSLTFLHRRLEHADSLLLDGCHTTLGIETYGLEYLPNCNTVPKVTVERFHADSLQPFKCPGVNSSAIQVKILRYYNNELATIGADTFANLTQVRELYFAANSLRHVARSAFDMLHSVERIHIDHEPLLALMDGDLFERTGVVELQLMDLKHITVDLFGHLPDTLRQICIARTAIDNDSVVVSNPQLLRNISFNHCTLKSFILHENVQTASVRHINLSGNALNEFRVDFGDRGRTESVAVVETLDLSANKLRTLPSSWLSGLRKLRSLLLRDNQLTVLSLSQLLVTVPLLVALDLRGNQLTSISDVASSSALRSAQMRIQIDHNPWNCLWLLDFAHTHPEKFRVLRYEKYISQINVNGLKCIPAVAKETAESENHATNTTITFKVDGGQVQEQNHSMENASIYKVVYSGPWEYKRSQRAEALIIVFLLPVGVALLFLLLYMWINCQKVFHLSYYRSIPWARRNTGRPFRSAERFDVVRQLPSTTNALYANTNNNDDYETPFSGIASVCNCNHIGDEAYDNEKCQKSHHITYEELPSQQPYKIYEEIIGDNVTDAGTYTQPCYDHLSHTLTKSDVNASI